LNSSLSYKITDSLDAMLTYTQYGKQKSRKNPENRMENGNNTYVNQLAGSEDIGGYAVWGLSAGYYLINAFIVHQAVQITMLILITNLVVLITQQ